MTVQVIKDNSVLIEPFSSCHLSSETELLCYMYRTHKSHEIMLVCLQIMIDVTNLYYTCSRYCHKSPLYLMFWLGCCTYCCTYCSNGFRKALYYSMFWSFCCTYCCTCCLKDLLFSMVWLFCCTCCLLLYLLF